jgi:tripeptide aminopeptidase
VKDALLERFLRYVQVPTTSDPDSRATPSTEGQRQFAHQLAGELAALGARDAEVTEHGYVLATLPADQSYERTPTVALLAHLDTAPDFSGTGVKPLLHRSYRGERIVLPDDRSQVLDPGEAGQTELQAAIGKDLVTASGRTLLGGDDKAGIAEIMTLAEVLLREPSVPHGRVRICFTPDEEIGRGVDHLDLARLGADVAYTVDGQSAGEVNWETFSADEALVEIRGVATHPGTARRCGMVNAVFLAGKLLHMLPRENLSPETTDGRQGFLHPARIEGDAARTTLRLILRDHDDRELARKGDLLRALCRALQAAYPAARVRCRISRQYRNMGNWLRDRPSIVEAALEACRRAGLEPISPATRGGTDGSRLTERGLPTPNLFSGTHNPHGPLEWVAVQDLEKATEVLLHLVQLWAEGERDSGRTFQV